MIKIETHEEYEDIRKLIGYYPKLKTVYQVVRVGISRGIQLAKGHLDEFLAIPLELFETREQAVQLTRDIAYAAPFEIREMILYWVLENPKQVEYDINIARNRPPVVIGP